jgi:hypothetical protein
MKYFDTDRSPDLTLWKSLISSQSMSLIGYPIVDGVEARHLTRR